MSQLTAFSLTRITYTGFDMGSAFSLTAVISGEMTQLNLTIPYGGSITPNEILFVDESSSSSINIPVNLHVQSGPPYSVHGFGNDIFTVPVGSPLTVTMTVNVVSQSANVAVLKFEFQAVPRVVPAMYTPDWLCLWPTLPMAYSGWLCAGSSLPNFYSFPEVGSIMTLMQGIEPTFTSMNSLLGLPYVPASSDFLGLLDYSLDSATAAVYRANDLTWRIKLTVSDFIDAVDQKVKLYIDRVVDLISFVPAPSPLCRDWFDLLNCYYNICQRLTSLDSSVVTLYNDKVVAEIDWVHNIAYTIANDEAIYTTFPYDPHDDQCRKIAYILSLFERRCRGRYCMYQGLTISDNKLVNAYTNLTPTYNQLRQLMEQFEVYLCTTKFESFCDRWRYVADCLMKICNRRDELSSAILIDFEQTFGSSIRNLYMLTRALQLLPTPGINKTCLYISMVDDAISMMCAWGYVPGGVDFDTFDNIVTQLRTALSGFASRHGDLCANEVVVTQQFCNDWLGLLNCLTRICDRKYEAMPLLINSFRTSFESRVDNLFNFLYPGTTPAVTSPGPLGIDVLCWKLNKIKTYFLNLCEDPRKIDPIRKTRIDAELALFTQKLNTLKATYPDICATTVSMPHCDMWKIMLYCLKRFCLLRHVLHSSIVQAVFDAFAPLVDYLHWLVSDPDGAPDNYYTQPESYSLEDMCEKVDDLIDYIEGICAATVVDPIRLMRLEDEFSKWVTAYNTVLQVPGLCGTQGSEEPGCDDFMEMLGCLKSLCERRGEVPQTIIDAFMTNFSSAIDAIYLQLFGQMPSYASGTIERLCAEISDLYETMAVCCGAPAEGEPDESGGVVTHPPEPQPDLEGCEDLQEALTPLLPAFRTLQQQLFNLGFTGGPNICNCFEVDCDAFLRLPKIFELLCCRTQPENFLTLPPIVLLSTWYQQTTPLLEQIVLCTGLNPSTMVPVGNGFCDKINHAIKVLIYGIASPGTLSALDRYKLRVRYKQLRTYAMQYAALLKDSPQPCSGCDVCGKWLEMLVCLCRACGGCKTNENLATLLAENSQICQRVDQLFHYIVAIPALPVLVEINPNNAVCCEKVHWLARFFALICLECNHTSYETYDLESYYANVASAYAGLRQQMSAASITVCDKGCQEWVRMLECLVNLGMHNREVPQSVRQQIETLLAWLQTQVYAMLDQWAFLLTPLDASNPLTESYTTFNWKMLELLRAFYWMCSPYYVWNSVTETGTYTLLPQWRTAYAEITTLLQDNGLGWICQVSDDLCGCLHEIPDIFALLCNGEESIDPLQGPGLSIKHLLDGYATEFAQIATQLSVTTTPPGTAEPVCKRLGYALGVIAAAYSRFDALSPQHKLMVRFFYSQLSYQYNDFRASLGDMLPHDPTPISEFRRNWMDVLGCACATCELLAGMTQAQRNAIPDVVEAHDDLLEELTTLYPAILDLAASAQLPIVADLCMEESSCGEEDRCDKLRVVISFFAAYCLSCAQAGEDTADAIDTLETALVTVREKIVLLRSELSKASITVCPEEAQGPVLMQSDYLYLQAVGSEGDDGDGSAGGIHLRWSLLQELGRKHLPKGNLAAPNAPYHTNEGFNRPDDFVKILRSRYKEDRRFPVQLDPITDKPTQIYSVSTMVAWVYQYDGRRADFLAADPLFPNASRTSITLRFLDKSQYTTLTAGRDPKNNQNDRLYLFDNYTGIMEAEPEKPLFRFWVEVQKLTSMSNPEVPIEGVSQLTGSVDQEKANPVITTRKRLPGTTGMHDLLMETVRFVRFRCDRCRLRMLEIETYHDYYYAIDRRYGWERVGDFALSVDDDEVFRRLEDSVHFVIHNHWPKYNDTRPAAGNETEKLNVCNYRERWNAWVGTTAPYPTDYGCEPHGRRAGDSVRDAVIHYLTESTEPNNWNPPIRRSSTLPNDVTQIELGVLDLLNIVAQDFHIARMLGLGYIDWQIPSMAGSPSQKYIYAAEYRSAYPLENNVIGAGTLHRYLSLPTSQEDHRLPVTPQFASTPLQLGLPKYSPDAPEFTDNNGYTKYGDARYVRIYKAPTEFDTVVLTETFNPTYFFSGGEFSRADNTRPFLYGVRYYKKDGGAFTEVLPQISNDQGEYAGPDDTPFTDKYRDAMDYPDGYPEPLAIPEPKWGDPLFVHHIVKPQSDVDLPKVEGVHKYGLYAVNWFSRVSPVTKMTDGRAVETKFPKRSTLLPPFNLRAQYITDENPRVFTSKDEQTNIETLRGLTRVTFDWNHTHNIAYQRGHRIDFFFRDSPVVIKGKIKGAPRVINNNEELNVSVTHYTDYSVKRPLGGKKTIPALPHPSDAARFIGAVFATANFSEKYIVVSVTVDSMPISMDDPRYRVRSFVVKRPFRLNDDGTKRWIDLKQDQYFICAENMNADGPWTALNNCGIEVIHFPGDYTVQETDLNGNPVTMTIGGIYEPTTVSLFDSENETAPPGIYKVAFDDYTLAPYSGAKGGNVQSVSWFGGTARIEDQTGKIRSLQVTRIDMVDPDNDNKTTIYIYDPDTASGGMELMQGEGVDINFHPGYRAYLNLVGAGIALNRIEPGEGELTCNTLIATRSVDPDQPVPSAPEPYVSPLTPAVVHLARKVVKLIRPRMPQGGRFATRPNFYGKSSYSFDTIFELADGGASREPYAMMFYRANQLDILRALYKPETIATILNDLPQRETDAHFEDRWRDLVNWVYDTDGERFKAYGDDGFRFPAPDNPLYTVLDEEGNTIYPFTAELSLEDLTDYIAAVFDTVLFPLTERPVIYMSIEEDETLTTLPDKPVIRDSDGELLDPDDSDYKPTPMMRRRSVTGAAELRFTDYTLDGGTTDFYFYCTREMDTAMKAGPRSGILGPIRLVNAYPPERPTIRSVNVELDNPAQLVTANVTIHLNPYLEIDNVTRLKLYRTYDLADSRSVAAMTLVGTFDNLSYVQDNFSVGELRYNEPIYYRVVALRQIINEREAVEHIPSAPSEVVMTNIVDAYNPEAPVISQSPSGPIGDPPVYATLVLTWPVMTYNGTYYLYKLDRFGNWVLEGIYGPNDERRKEYTNLPKENEDGNEIFHYFKVVVENSAGLRNLEDEVLTV